MKSITETTSGFDLETWMKRQYIHRREFIKTFLIAFTVNVLVYMPKLTWHSLAIDDYTRFLGSEDQAANQGRWGANILNNLFFQGHQHIVPYFNGLIGVFSFTLAGFITAKIFGVRDRFQTVVFTLLCSLSVFIAHNLYYNTNITVWLSVFFCVLGTYFLLRQGVVSRAFGFALLIFSIANYQTNLQLYLMVVFSLWLYGLLKKDKPTVKFVFSYSAISLGLFIVGVAAMLVSMYINLLWVELIGVKQYGTFAKAFSNNILDNFITNIGRAYSTSLKLRYFEEIFYLFFFIPIIVFVLLFLQAWNSNKRLVFFLLALAVSTYYVIFPLIIALPNLVGFGVLPRAHYTIGWFFAIMYLFSCTFSNSNSTKSVILLLSAGLLLLSAVYINIYFYAAYRQTQDDIHRVNNIVTQIRMHDKYIGEEEPLSLMLVGEKKFPVVGWTTRREALRYSWSKYQIFDYFTDMNFVRMSNEEYQKFKEKEQINKDTNKSYPAKSAIVVRDGKVVVVLDDEKI